MQPVPISLLTFLTSLIFLDRGVLVLVRFKRKIN